MEKQAIHLETVILSADESLFAIRRLVLQRGYSGPADILFSDNGPNFTGGKKSIDRVRAYIQQLHGATSRRTEC